VDDVDVVMFFTGLFCPSRVTSNVKTFGDYRRLKRQRNPQSWFYTGW